MVSAAAKLNQTAVNAALDYPLALVRVDPCALVALLKRKDPYFNFFLFLDSEEVLGSKKVFTESQENTIKGTLFHFSLLFQNHSKEKS